MFLGFSFWHTGRSLIEYARGRAAESEAKVKPREMKRKQKVVWSIHDTDM